MYDQPYFIAITEGFCLYVGGGSETSPSVFPTHHTTYPGSRVELAWSILTQMQSSSLNVSWVKKPLDVNTSEVRVSPTASYLLQGHILVLGSVEESDGGQYCCRVGAALE